jgi:hypothetical protein
MTRANPAPREPIERRPRARGRAPLHKRPVVVALGSAMLGFCCGAMFWHAVGFWSFVSDVVLKGPDDGTPAMVKEAKSTEPQPVSSRATGSISPVRVAVGGVPSAAIKARLHCSVAIPDPAFGEVHIFPCAPGTGQPPSKPLARKGDRLDSAAAASTAATAPETAVQPLTPKAVPPPAAQAAQLPQKAATTAPTGPAPSAWSPTIRGSAR